MTCMHFILPRASFHARSPSSTLRTLILETTGILQHRLYLPNKQYDAATREMIRTNWMRQIPLYCMCHKTKLPESQGHIVLR